MGYDITYHPITPEWAERSFFSQLAPVRRGDASGARAEERRAGLDDGAAELYESLLDTAASWDDPLLSFELLYDDMVAGAPRGSDIRQDPEAEWQQRWEAGGRPL